jgi:uncharacterized paraquat-inducible protein A
MQSTVTLPATVSLTCPGCDARIRAPRQLLGAKRPCPRCRHTLVVHVPAPTDSGVHLVYDDRKPSR